MHQMPTSGSNNETSLCLPAPWKRRHTRSVLKERKREGRMETRRERGGRMETRRERGGRMERRGKGGREEGGSEGGKREGVREGVREGGGGTTQLKYTWPHPPTASAATKNTETKAVCKLLSGIFLYLSPNGRDGFINLASGLPHLLITPHTYTIDLCLGHIV